MEVPYPRVNLKAPTKASFFISTMIFTMLAIMFFGLTLSFNLKSPFAPKIAHAESVNVNLLVHVCNMNLICEDVIGENYGSCPSDCEAPPEPPAPTSTPPSTQPGTGGSQSGGGYTDPNYGSTTSGYPMNPNFPNRPGTIRPGTNGQNNNANNAGNNHGQNIQGQNGPNNNGGIGAGIGTNTGSVIRPPGSIPQTGIDGPITIAPYTTRATLNFKTYLASLLNISWGETATYEKGSSADSWYHQNFSKDITGLEPGRKYYYRFQLIDSLGRESEYEGQFITASERSRAPLPVVVNFFVNSYVNQEDKESNSGANLWWSIKPPLETILKDINERDLIKDVDDKEKKIFVRLTRSEFGYPQDPFEGKVIYEGSGEQATDIGLKDEAVYLYSIFVMNGKGEYSAPAVLRYTHNPGYPNNIDEDSPKNSSKNYKNPIQSLFDPLLQDPNPIAIEKWSNPDDLTGFCGFSESVMPALSLKDTFSDAGNEYKNDLSIQFLKGGQILPVISGLVSTDGSQKLIIRVKNPLFEDRDKVGICLFSKDSLTYTHYLLSKNVDGTFELIFPAISSIFSEKRDYQFTIGMIKYNGEEVVLERGEISFFIPSKNHAVTWWEILFFIIVTGVIVWLRRKFDLFAIKHR